MRMTFTSNVDKYLPDIKFTLSPWEYGYVFSALSNHIGGVMANVLS
jgi:hypothetical protein